MKEGLILNLTQGINPLVTPEVGSICQRKTIIPNSWWFFEPGTGEVKEKRLDLTDDPGNKLLAVPEVDPQPKKMI